MGECHLCENISSIDALILMTRVTFVSHTLELDKYRREMSWLIPVRSGTFSVAASLLHLLHSENLPQHLFASSLDLFNLL